MSARSCEAEQRRKGPKLWGPFSLQTECSAQELARLQRRCGIAFAVIMVGCALLSAAIILAMLLGANF